MKRWLVDTASQLSGSEVSSTLLGLLDFLDEHPKEIDPELKGTASSLMQVILGFNNLHNSASKTFGEADIVALCHALETAIGRSCAVVLCHFRHRAANQPPPLPSEDWRPGGQ